MSYKVGDRVFHGWEDSKVTKVEDDRVTEVKFGCILASGHDLQVAPYNKANKAFAAYVEAAVDELHDLHGSQGLNWPDIARYFSSVCAWMMAGEIYASQARDLIDRVVKEVAKALAPPISSAGFRIFR